MEKLLHMSACDQLRAFRRRKISPADLLEVQIEHIERHGAKINAVAFKHFSQARRAARESAARYREGCALALDGITVAIKDEFDREGWKTTHGSRIADSAPKTRTHPLIQNLLAAGAILHIQTTTPEFHLLPVTWSDRWGVTRNPWNPSITPGGSSGGSAAVTAAGMSTLALGSDMGGSVRIPAALCGLFGFKPPYGRTPAMCEEALLVQASAGPLARTLNDLILMQAVLAGPVEDAIAMVPNCELPRRFPAVRGWKIAFTMDQGWASVASDVKQCIRRAMRVLQDSGAAVEEVSLDLGLDAPKLRACIEMALFSTAIGGELAEKDASRLTTYGRRFRNLAKDMTAKHAKTAAQAATRVHQELANKVFKRGYRALICPTVSSTEVRADYDPTSDRLSVAGKQVEPYVGWFQTSIFNLLNWMPVINVPAGHGRNGVPVGFQIAARAYDDASMWAIAAAYASRREPSVPGEPAQLR